MSGDAGIFGPDSVAWRIHADPVMLVGGLRALLVQALEPRAMAAVDQHSKFREDPWGRLERTTNFVVATTYGDTATAEAAAARVRKVHEHIHGVDPVTGKPYAANDPDLLLWIHAVEVDSFLLAYRTYAGRVTREEGDRYVRELQATPAAFDGLRVVMFPPMDLKYRPLWAIPTTAAIAILPSYARRLYRIPWFPPAALPVRTAVFALSRVLNLVTPTPPSLREARERVE